MTQQRHKAGRWCKHCHNCGKKMTFKYYCHAKVRKYCSTRCRTDKLHRDYWSSEDDAVILKEYTNSSHPKLLAQQLGKSCQAIHARAKELGLERNAEVISAGYADGGKMNKGRPRPDLAANAFRGSGPNNPFYKKHHTAETRKKLSEQQKKIGTFKRLSKCPDFQRKRMRALRVRPNAPERVIAELLNKLFPDEYRYTGDGSVVIDGLIPDFTNVNGQKKIIEVFGEQYHDPKLAVRPISERSTEPGRRKALAKFGYSLLVIWSKEIYAKGALNKAKLIAKLRNFHEDYCC